MAAFVHWRSAGANGPVVIIGPGADGPAAGLAQTGEVRVVRPLGRWLQPIDRAVRQLQPPSGQARVRPWGRRAWQWCATRGADLGIVSPAAEHWADREVAPPPLEIASADERAELRNRLGVGKGRAIVLMGSPPAALDLIFATELLTRAGVCGAELTLIVPEGVSDLSQARAYLAATRVPARISTVGAGELERMVWCADVALFSGPSTAGESRGRPAPSAIGAWWAIDAGLLLLASTESRPPTGAVEYLRTGVRDGEALGAVAPSAQLSVFPHGDVNAVSRSLLEPASAH